MACSFVNDAPVPVRATYANLYKWPESDAEFVKSIISANMGKADGQGQSRVVDGFSCRQLYLRSYIFSREDDYTTINCLGRAKHKIKRRSGGGGGRKSADSIFRRLLSCTNKIYVGD
ncbi:hypothetical protein Pfo_007141 [Paulownia fortunei]|nr:hypothetical protein Pfo_007141 [Paulownia fortunei]